MDTEHVSQPGPQRGDAIEVWLKSWRDRHQRGFPSWYSLDDVLDDYRIHADTGTPLDQEVSEGGEL